jgi:TetR/AcrR family transcriptional regulator
LLGYSAPFFDFSFSLFLLNCGHKLTAGHYIIHMGTIERKEREKEERKRIIIQAAEKIFLKKGLEGATMEEIADLAELSKGTLYLYFRNKEELFFSVNMRGLQLLAEILEKEIDESVSAADNALALGKAYIKFSKDYPDYFRTIMTCQSTGLEQTDLFQKTLFFEEGSPLLVFLNVIEKGHLDGTIRSDIPAIELAVVLWSQLTGVLQYIHYRPKVFEMFSIDENKIIQNLFYILQDGIIRNVNLPI